MKREREEDKKNKWQRKGKKSEIGERRIKGEKGTDAKEGRGKWREKERKEKNKGKEKDEEKQERREENAQTEIKREREKT